MGCVGDIDTERGTVRVNKSLEEVGGNLAIKAPKTPSSIRTVKLSTTTMNALEEHRRAMLAEGHCTPDAPVFCGPRSGTWLRKSDVFRHSFAPILKRASLKFRFHDLRHASATLLLADGVDIKTVQSRLGHSAAAVTLDVYAAAIPVASKLRPTPCRRFLHRSRSGPLMGLDSGASERMGQLGYGWVTKWPREKGPQTVTPRFLGGFFSYPERIRTKTKRTGACVRHHHCKTRFRTQEGV